MLGTHINCLRNVLDSKIKNFPYKVKVLIKNIYELKRLLRKLEFSDSLDFLNYLLGFIEVMRKRINSQEASCGLWHNNSNLDLLIFLARTRVLKFTSVLEFNTCPNPYFELAYQKIKNLTETKTPGKVLVVLPSFQTTESFKQFLIAEFENKLDMYNSFRLKSCLKKQNILLSAERKVFEIAKQLDLKIIELESFFDTEMELEFDEKLEPIEIVKQKVSFQSQMLRMLGFDWETFNLGKWTIECIEPKELLESLRKLPNYLILLTSNLQVIRQLEVHCAETIDNPSLELVTLINSGLSDSFCFKAHYQAEYQALASFSTFEPLQLSCSVPSTEETVIVDKREFTSSLPYYLCKRGLKVVPYTLKTGDYVLSPQICVERKSAKTDDIVTSLLSGRLYEQLKVMCSNYTYCYLLIEFKEDTAFSLTGCSGFSPVPSKLAETLKDFPVNVLWSTSPEQSAELFLQLKKIFKHNQPSASDVKQTKETESSYLKVLRKLPNLSESSLCVLSSEYQSMYLLSLATLEQLSELIGPNEALHLYNFLRT